MCCFRVFAGISFLLATCLVAVASTEITIKVVDPQGAWVAGAQVQLLKPGKPAPAAVLNTSAEGVAVFREAVPGAYRVQVLAAGFAVETAELSLTDENVTIKLRVASASETLVVTATRTPVPSEAAGAEVSTLSSAQLETMQPI